MSDLSPKDFYPQYECETCKRVVHYVLPQLCEGTGDRCMECDGKKMRRLRGQDR